MNNQSLRTEKLFFVIVILLVAIIAARVPLDSDMWWHLKAGQTTVESGRPTLQDTMSFTRQGEPWVNHSWLTQVFLYLLFEEAGFWGLEGYVVLLAVLIAIFIWLQMREPPAMKAFVLLAGAFIFSTVLTPRPQLISLLFLGVNWLVCRCIFESELQECVGIAINIYALVKFACRCCDWNDIPGSIYIRFLFG